MHITSTTVHVPRPSPQSSRETYGDNILESVVPATSIACVIIRTLQHPSSNWREWARKQRRRAFVVLLILASCRRYTSGEPVLRREFSAPASSYLQPRRHHCAPCGTPSIMVTDTQTLQFGIYMIVILLWRVSKSCSRYITVLKPDCSKYSCAGNSDTPP